MCMQKTIYYTCYGHTIIPKDYKVAYCTYYA